MPVWSIVLIAVICGVILLLFAFAAISYKFGFCRRYDKNPLLKYFSAEDFSLSAESYKIGDLSGNIYVKEGAPKRDEVIIFVHGMGPGQAAYTTEIAYFCNLGYTVVATDAYGCGQSAGKSIKGMYKGVDAAIKTVDFVKDKFGDKKIYLVGHSWGGYSVLCAAGLKKVEKVVAISAPVSPVKTAVGASSAIISKPVALILSPFWCLINWTECGARGNANAVKYARQSNAKILLVQGDRDGVVSANKSAFAADYGKNVEKYLAEGKAHNPYNTVGAEKKLAELSNALRRAAKMTEEERKEYFSSFDFIAATEEDEKVMQVIADFLNS